LTPFQKVWARWSAMFTEAGANIMNNAGPALLWFADVVAGVAFFTQVGFKSIQVAVLGVTAGIAQLLAVVVRTDAMKAFAASLADSLDTATSNLVAFIESNGKIDNLTNSADNLVSSFGSASTATVSFAKTLDELDDNSDKTKSAIDRLADIQRQIVSFDHPAWFADVLDMINDVGADSPLIKMLIAANKQLDEMKKKADDMTRGKHILESMQSPQEKLNATMDDLRRLRDVGALGKPGTWESQRAFTNAQAAAIEEYSKSITDVTGDLRTPLEKYRDQIERLKEARASGGFGIAFGESGDEMFSRAMAAAKADYDETRRDGRKQDDIELPRALEAGTNEAWKAIVSAMYKQPSEKDDIKQTAKNTKTTADTLRAMYANRPQPAEEVDI